MYLNCAAAAAAAASNDSSARCGDDLDDDDADYDEIEPANRTCHLSRYDKQASKQTSQQARCTPLTVIIIVIFIRITVQRDSKYITSSPWGVTFSWQHGYINKMTHRHSKLGQTDLVFGL